MTDFNSRKVGGGEGGRAQELLSHKLTGLKHICKICQDKTCHVDGLRTKSLTSVINVQRQGSGLRVCIHMQLLLFYSIYFQYWF